MKWLLGSTFHSNNKNDNDDDNNSNTTHYQNKPEGVG